MPGTLKGVFADTRADSVVPGLMADEPQANADTPDKPPKDCRCSRLTMSTPLSLFVFYLVQITTRTRVLVVLEGRHESQVPDIEGVRED